MKGGRSVVPRGVMVSGSSSSNVLADRVLVVDDDVNFHRLAEAALAEAGFRAVCVRSGEEAQRLMAESKPLAVVLDGLLPGVRGDELARRIRRNYSRNALPIVFVSAFYRDMKSYRLLTGECGVDVVLHKPIGLGQLRSAIERLLRPAAFPTTVTLQPVNAAQAAKPKAEPDLAQEIELILEAGRDLDEVEDEEDEDDFYETPEMVQLRAEYLNTSAERVQELRAALGRLSGPAAEDALHMIRVEGHRFAGSGTSYGYDEISRLGLAIEDLIQGDPALHRSEKKRALLTGLVEALVEKVQAAAGAAPIPLERRVFRAVRRVLLLDVAGTPLLAAAREAAKGNQPIDATTDLDEALKRGIELRPDAIFVACDLASPAAVERLHTGTSAPVVVLGERDRLEAWIELLRAGAVGFAARPPDVEALFRLAAVYARARTTASVLAVGADRAALSEVAEMLAPRGVAVQPCATTEEFFGSLERAAPSLVILDGDLPRASGLDLLRVLRADVSFRRVPVIAIAADDDPGHRLAAFRAGADGWLARPFDPEELAVRAHSLLAHASLQSFAQRDPLTGLFDRGYLVEACERALQLGRREGRQVALLAFDLHLDELRREQGRLAADGVLMEAAARLSAAFRSSDVVARIGGARLAVLLHGAGEADAKRLLQQTLAELGKLGVGGWRAAPTGAIATFPEVTGGADALLAAAERKFVAA